MAVEFRSGLDDAWYDVLIANDGCDRLRVKFVGFGDDHDELYEVSELSSFNDIDEFSRRFRPLSVQVQDTDCSQVVKGMLVCASHSIRRGDRRFYDAVVKKDKRTSRRPLSLISSLKDGIVNPSQGAGHDMDVEEVPYVMTIENLEKGLSPLKIVEFIHQQLSISCQAFVSPSLSSEWYTRGIILLDSRKNVDKLSDFLESPDHIIISSSGSECPKYRLLVWWRSLFQASNTALHIRPWVMTEKRRAHDRLRGSIVNSMLISQKLLERRRTNTCNELKVVSSGTEEYMRGKLLQDLFCEYSNQQHRLHQKLLVEEGKIWQLFNAA
ncbi:uncharacterized protein [Pyrus communis]|uniref:uncharacterized protein isoform X4 n=1 Tax=Pyrus communis TaxID=23211 RepID=UPI0035C23C1E